MSNEIKPVYQSKAEHVDWYNISKDVFDILTKDGFETRILYHAAAYEALQKEKTKIEDELDQYKEHHKELTEHYRALQFLESEFRKENESLNAEVFRLKNELITSLKDWHDLNANNAALQKENEELKEELDDEKQKGVALWKNVESRCKEIDALKAENAAQAKLISDLKASLQECMDAAIESIDSDHGVTPDRIMGYSGWAEKARALLDQEPTKDE